MSIFKRLSVLILTTFLFSCSPPPPPSSDLSSNAEPEETETLVEEQNPQHPETQYRGHFEYSLENCNGDNTGLYENKVIPGFMEISINNDQIQLSRPNFDPDLKVGIRGIWNETNKKFNNVQGNFGIASNEDWANTSGRILISPEEISGQIYGIQISHKDISCTVSMEFAGDIIPE